MMMLFVLYSSFFVVTTKGNTSVFILSTVLVNIADVDGFRCVNLELSDGLPVLKKYESFFRELGVDSQRVEIEHLT